ncbi:hypothetical protein B296_00018428, partial [Ensete ventricosum]
MDLVLVKWGPHKSGGTLLTSDVRFDTKDEVTSEYTSHACVMLRSGMTRGGKRGSMTPYDRPGTGKVGNPHRQAHASPPVRRAWREARQH